LRHRGNYARCRVCESQQINGTTIRLLKGDFTQLDVDGFVLYAQPDLALGTGVGTAISIRGGPSIQQTLEDLGPVATGKAVISTARNLPAKYIVHAVGPRFQEENAQAKLRATILSAFDQAADNGIERIAFPAMGAGYYGIEPDICAEVMFSTIKDYLGNQTKIKEVTICVLDTRQHKAFEAQLTRSPRR